METGELLLLTEQWTLNVASPTVVHLSLSLCVFQVFSWQKWIEYEMHNRAFEILNGNYFEYIKLKLLRLMVVKRQMLCYYLNCRLQTERRWRWAAEQEVGIKSLFHIWYENMNIYSIDVLVFIVWFPIFHTDKFPFSIKTFHFIFHLVWFAGLWENWVNFFFPGISFYQFQCNRKSIGFASISILNTLSNT